MRLDKTASHAQAALRTEQPEPNKETKDADGEFEELVRAHVRIEELEVQARALRSQVAAYERAKKPMGMGDALHRLRVPIGAAGGAGIAVVAHACGLPSDIVSATIVGALLAWIGR